jgi:signal peptidase II
MEASDSSRSRAGSKVGVNEGEAIAARSLLARRAAIFAVIAVVGAGIDLWTKQAIFDWRGLPGERDAWWIVDGVFGIETAVNPGAVFGVGAGKGMLFAAFSVVAAVGILVWLFWFRGARSLWLTWALGLITGGILGNLYDRLGMWWQPHLPQQWRSGVRDWILFRIEGVPLFDPWPNFNVADSLLVVGAGMLMYQSLVLEGKQDRLRDESGEESTAGPSG